MCDEHVRVFASAGRAIGRNVLSERLKFLVGEDVLTRVPYEKVPLRYEYRLTEKGAELCRVLLAMHRWGDDWLSGKSGPPIEIVDARSGRVVTPAVYDANTGEPIDLRTLRVRPRPGFPRSQRDQMPYAVAFDAE